MCGLCGAFGLHGDIDPSLHNALQAMNDAIRHRGPDEDGFFRDKRVALGHRRLSIIDVAAGHQPMSDPDGRFQIVFNGEIYNHLALRAELEPKGYEFRTHCDTETIIHAYAEWGTSCPERLFGMFAFAIYDAREGTMFLARDRLGKKPLFYAEFDGMLHFASEVASLRESPLWNGEVDRDLLEPYFALGYIPAPATIYRKVKKLEPGHWLLARDGRITTQSYWDVTDFDSDTRSTSEIADAVDALLGECVSDRLESEVPLGAFLSGGIDSGLIVSYMADALENSPLTCSVGFGDKEHNELEAAGLTASRFATQHHTEMLKPDLTEILPHIAPAFDEPFADPSAIPTWYVCRMARQHVTVCLSGDGGDESFGGYDFRYLPHAWEESIRRRLPGRPAQALLRALGRVWPRRRWLPRFLRLGTVLDNLGGDAVDAYFSDLCFLKPREVGQLIGSDIGRDPRSTWTYGAATDAYRRCPSDSVIQRAEYADLKVYLPNDVLVKVDRMSMQHSLEVRCPLLDHRLVELAFRIPMSSKMPDLEPKHLLRRLGKRRLPPELLTMPKRGFTAPVGRWLAERFADVWTDEVLAPNSFCSTVTDIELLRRWQKEHRAGQRDRSYPLWAAWMLERWHAATRVSD
ncbi:MAG: asparagine synthase (glutamine-hydrolyzing) [Planctomycetota bacterium]|jgi:asparagine synthase (glutamine-hydrolysing)